MPESLPYKRLSAFYFWYYGLLGVTHPFWALFLSHRQFTAAEIGLLLSVQMATRIVSPGLWGWLADHTGKRMETIRLGSLFGMLSFAGIFFVDDFWGMMLVIGCYSFFWNALMPQFEALTLEHLADRPADYSRIRLWGSVGFIAAVIAGGYWFQGRIEDFRIAGLMFLVMIWLATFFMHARSNPREDNASLSFVDAARQRPVLAFLALSFLLQLAHGIYYTFYSLHLEDIGYTRTQIGGFWALSVVAEIALFLVMHRWLTAWSLHGILVCSLLLTGCRWVLIGIWAESIVVLVFAQCLHAFSFGACHAISIEYLRRFFPGSLRGRGQALYTSTSFGAGGAAGALAGGLLWGYSGLAAFSAAAIVSVAAAVIAGRELDPRRQPRGTMREILSG